MAANLSAVIQTALEQPPADAWSILAGFVAFGSTLAASTFTQGRILGISTGSRFPMPFCAGLASVCAASLASHHASIAAHEYVTYGRKPRALFAPWDYQSNALFSFREDHLDLKIVQIPLHTVRICTVGLIAFKLFGGRFWAIAPSSFTDLGSFARPKFSIAATHRYASTTERVAVERMGRAVGCHTCGTHMIFQRSAVKFVGDHMPPKAVANQLNSKWYRQLLGINVPFRFYPQCVKCSSIQGSILSKATQFTFARNLAKAGGGSQAYFHGFSPRPNHFAGGVVAAVAVVGAREEDIMDGNRWRYASLHRQADKWVQRGCRDLRRAWSR